MSTTTDRRGNPAAGSVIASRADVATAELPAARRRIDAGLAVLRVIVGAVFLAHGAQKLFVLGLPGLAEGFSGAGVPLPSVTAPAVALTELLGGIALAAGLFTRVTAAALAVVMLGAMLYVHLAAGFFLPNGAEFALTLFAVAIAFVLAGPGAWSVDSWLARRRSVV